MLGKSSMARIATLLCLIAFSTASPANVSEPKTEVMEDSTVSPIADMAIIESEMKTSTERPATVALPKENEQSSSQRPTVSDFIIHPLIALQPRRPEDGFPAEGKQATNTNNSSTQYPWQLFNFTPGQSIISSSVSSLAGSVSNWINDRIPFPGLVDTPVRESTTTTTTTTTTPQPDIIVRVQHKPHTTRRPLISIANNPPNFDSGEEHDEEDYEETDDPELSNGGGENEEVDEKEEGDNYDENGNEEDDENDIKDFDREEDGNDVEENTEDEEEEDHSERPNKRRKPMRNKSKKTQRRGNSGQGTRRRVVYKRQRPYAPIRRFPQDTIDDEEEEVLDYDYSDDLDDDNDNDDDEFADEQYYSTKRSQSSPNFFQRGQQQLIKQIRQFTRAQSPKEMGTSIRKAQKKSTLKGQRKQGTLFLSRNGNPIYIAPELSQPQYQKVYAKPVLRGSFPQPPLTKPLRLEGETIQYITIPWTHLGISPPQSAVAIGEGIQSKPLILNIPQSALSAMQSESQTQSGKGKRKRKRPQLITAEAVPVIAEASLMDIFKTPQMPPSRSSSSKKPTEQVESESLADSIVQKKSTKDDLKKPESTDTTSSNMPKGEEKKYILVGKDDEPGLTRQVEPVYGRERFFGIAGSPQYVLPGRRFAIRREGRSLSETEESSLPNKQSGANSPQSIKEETPSIASSTPLAETTQVDAKPTTT